MAKTEAKSELTKANASWPDWYRAFWEYSRDNGLPEPRRQQLLQPAYEAGLTPQQAARSNGSRGTDG